MQISFFIRQGTGKFCGIYVHITIDKVRTKTAFSSGIKILETEWNAKTKTIKNFERNLELQALKDRIQHIYNVHYMEGKYITAEELRNLHLQNIKTRLPEVAKPQIKITDLLNAFLENREKAFSANIITANTLKTQKSYLNHWKTFFEKIPNLKPEDLNRTHLEAYLAGEGKTSSKKVQIFLLKKVYAFCKSEKLITYFEFPNYETETVFFDNEPLENTVLEIILANHKLKPTLQSALDLFKIQIFTGLAYIDTQNFKATKHIKQIKEKPFICLKRQKTQRKTKLESVVPIFEETRELMAKYEGDFPKIAYHVYSKSLTKISILLKISPLHSHKARKTATYYLTTIKGYDRDLVRIMLGHSSDAMGDRHYLNAMKYMEGKL